MDFLLDGDRLGAGLEQIGIDQALFENARDVVQHEADVGRCGHWRTASRRQLFVSMLIIIMHIILLDAARKTD
jgi:hypothetical protein